MKKLIISLFAVVALTASVQAGEQAIASFFPANITTLCVSNTLGVTNLTSYGVITTNVTGVTWTNSANTRVVAAGDGGVTDYQALVQDVDLSQFYQGMQVPIGTL